VSYAGLKETASITNLGLCPACKEETVDGTAALQLSRQGIAFSLAGVPAHVCPVCSEAYIEPKLARPIWDCVTTTIQQIIAARGAV
jgi:YgiT-type zinc finger domain-containing protein